MIQSIVVPLDGSRFSETALPSAARLARSAGARLRLLMVHEPVMGLVPVADVPTPDLPDDPELRAQEQTYLADTAGQLGSVGGALVSYELLDGLAAPALEEAFAKDPPDLVVMSTHGRGALSRFWLGSVAEHVIRHVSVPVLLLRPRDGSGLPAEPLEIRRVLVPVDLSEASEAILEPVTALASVTQAHLTLMTVVEPVLGIVNTLPYPVPLEPDFLETRRAEAQAYLDQLADRLRARGFRVATKVVIGIGVAAMILERQAKDRHDLVAITTHGAGGFRRVMLGSVADKVIRGAQSPVLVFRPPQYHG